MEKKIFKDFLTRYKNSIHIELVLKKLLSVMCVSTIFSHFSENNKANIGRK